MRFPILFVTVFTLLMAGCGMVKQSYLDSFVESEKGNLPKRLFSNLEAIEVGSGETELIYTCIAKNVSDEDAKNAQRQTQKAVQDYVRRNNEKLKDLIDNKIKLTIALMGQDTTTELYRITVNPWEIK